MDRQTMVNSILPLSNSTRLGDNKNMVVNRKVDYQVEHWWCGNTTVFYVENKKTEKLGSNSNVAVPESHGPIP